MKSSEERLNEIINHCNEILKSLPKYWKMYAGNMTTAEFRALDSIYILEFALELPFFDWRKWCAKRYPDVPGPIRDLVSGSRHIAKITGEDVEIVFSVQLEQMIQSAINPYREEKKDD